MRNARQKRGDWGEGVAAGYLENKGIKVLERNVRSVFGEIDLICAHGKELVCVEVKTRSSNIYGNPEEAITLSKQRKLRLLAEWYWKAHPQYASVRVDIVSIRTNGSTIPEIHHIEAAL